MTSVSKVIFIVGPTAVGKTALAIKLARAIGGEIISCDSMQVYRGMKILSQAPSLSERRAVTHHLVGALSPGREYSAAIFRQKANRLIKSIIRRKKIPIVVGGSGLYVKALVDGLFPTPAADAAFRKRMQNFVSRHGSERLHEKLSGIDPCAAAKIHQNDARRIIRALEIYDSTGRTMTEMKDRTRGLAGEYDIKTFGITKSRDGIYSDINRRVERMFGSGALDEVKRLRRRMPLSKTAKAALGFKEIAGYLDGEYDLNTAKELLKRNTRRFAKRQFTWFKADKRIRWLDLDRMRETDILRKMTREVK